MAFPFRPARTACAVLLIASLPASADEFQPDTLSTTTIPAAMQRVYVADPALPHMVDGRVYVLDAADMSLKGMMESGFAGMLLIVRPGGTGMPRRHISARLAPLPPRRFFIPAAPSVPWEPNR